MPGAPGLLGRAAIRAGDGIRGIATSGWRGRSHSLGIADAVTVLAATASAADAAATIIANAVDLPGHPAIARRPARALSPDSDLGTRLVTVGVGALPAAEIDRRARRRPGGCRAPRAGRADRRRRALPAGRVGGGGGGAGPSAGAGVSATVSHATF